MSLRSILLASPLLISGACTDKDTSDEEDDTGGGQDTSTEDCEDEDALTWYPDLDGDGFGADTDPVVACDPPSGHVDNSSDCDDDHDYVYPGAVEICDGWDTDCDASTGEEGTVLLEDASGVLWDLTAEFETDVSDPVRIELDSEGGDYWFCEGTYGAILEVTASVDIRGRAEDFTTTGFYGNNEETVLSVVGDGLEVEIHDLFITAGLGTGTLSFGDSELTDSGGGISCVGSNSLSLEGVSIWDNYGVGGGGIASDGCELTLTDSSVFDNTGWLGGGIMLVDADLTLNTTEITTNSAAADGSAIYQYAGSIDLSFSMTDSLIHDNASDEAGDGIVYLHSDAGAIDAICTGSTSISAGIIANSAGDTAALVLDEEGSGLVFESAGCDWGTEDGEDDNSPADILSIYDMSLLTRENEYRIGDDYDIVCEEGSCGTPTTQTLGDDSSSASTSEAARGNIITAENTATLDSFALELDPGETCDLTFYILSESSSGSWSVEYEYESVASSSGWQTVDNIGMAMDAGTTYALLAGWDCEMTVYNDSAAGSSSLDGGFGTSSGCWKDTSFSGSYSGTVSESICTNEDNRFHMQITTSR